MGSRSASSPPRRRLDVRLPDAFRDLFRPYRYKAFYGGRGSGKSHSMATALLLLAAQKPLRVLAAREVQKSIRDSSKRLLEDRIGALGLDRRFTATENEIRSANGSLFLFAERIARFGRLMQERMNGANVNAKRGYITSVVGAIEVYDERVRVVGLTDTLKRAVAGQVEGDKIRGFVRKWRAQGESNPCFRRERATSWTARRRERRRIRA